MYDTPYTILRRSQSTTHPAPSRLTQAKNKMRRTFDNPLNFLFVKLYQRCLAVRYYVENPVQILEYDASGIPAFVSCEPKVGNRMRCTLINFHFTIGLSFTVGGESSRLIFLSRVCPAENRATVSYAVSRLVVSSILIRCM